MKKVLIILFFIWFFISNYFLYINKNIGLFNDSILDYNQWKYNNSINKLNYLYKLKNNNYKEKILYNLANNFYKKSLQENGTKKIEFLEKSASFYKQSLQEKYDKKTEKNLYFVKNKIEQEKKQDIVKKEIENKKVSENIINTDKDFTKEESKQLYEYEKKLKEEQINIWKKYNKKIENTDPTVLFEQFVSNSNISFEEDLENKEKDR